MGRRAGSPGRGRTLPRRPDLTAVASPAGNTGAPVAIQRMAPTRSALSPVASIQPRYHTLRSTSENDWKRPGGLRGPHIDGSGVGGSSGIGGGCGSPNAASAADMAP
jgi:hypothetical protein